MSDVYQRLYADSPIDSSLYSLYIQQNYPQFCDDIDQCDGVADWLSWVDSSGGESVSNGPQIVLLDSDVDLTQWYQANPHRFHLLTLGTLHSLPSPVTRRSQKIYKPAFFDHLQKEKDAWEGVRDVQEWVSTGGDNVVSGAPLIRSNSKHYRRLGSPLPLRDGVGQKLPWSLVVSCGREICKAIQRRLHQFPIDYSPN